jgi:hypothetical protein
VTFIVPISAAIELATRAATIRPPRTGPSSRHPDGNNRRHHRLGIEARAAGIDLQGKGTASEDRRQADNRQGKPADLQKRHPKLAQIERRPQDMAKDGGREERHATHGGDGQKNRAADRAKGCGHAPRS